MSVRPGNLRVIEVYRGAQRISEAYQGGNLLYDRIEDTGWFRPTYDAHGSSLGAGQGVSNPLNALDSNINTYASPTPTSPSGNNGWVRGRFYIEASEILAYGLKMRADDDSAANSASIGLCVPNGTARRGEELRHDNNSFGSLIDLTAGPDAQAWADAEALPTITAYGDYNDLLGASAGVLNQWADMGLLISGVSLQGAGAARLYDAQVRVIYRRA